MPRSQKSSDGDEEKDHRIVTAEYNLAWAIIVIVISIGTFGLLYLILSGPFDHFVELSKTETPAYAANRTTHAINRHAAIWGLLPLGAAFSFIVWGVVRAITERDGGGGL